MFIYLSSVAELRMYYSIFNLYKVGTTRLLNYMSTAHWERRTEIIQVKENDYI